MFLLLACACKTMVFRQLASAPTSEDVLLILLYQNVDNGTEISQPSTSMWSAWTIVRFQTSTGFCRAKQSATRAAEC